MADSRRRPTVHVDSAWYRSSLSLPAKSALPEPLVKPRQRAQPFFPPHAQDLLPRDAALGRRERLQPGLNLFEFPGSWGGGYGESDQNHHRKEGCEYD